MSTLQKVQSAESLPAALAAIAEALDRIEQQQLDGGHPEVDPWQWPAAESAAAVHAEPVAEIARLREEIAQSDDPKEHAALEAKLRLLQDTGAVVPTPPRGVEMTVTVNNEEVTVDVPRVGAARRAVRRTLGCSMFAYLTQAHGLTEPEFADTYAVGGPLWLHAFDRDAVMSMPREWRARMVHDVDQDSPAQAGELARDILKVPTAGDPDEYISQH